MFKRGAFLGATSFRRRNEMKNNYFLLILIVRLFFVHPFPVWKEILENKIKTILI